MAQRVMVANFGVLAATSVWTLGWIAATALAAERVSSSNDVPSLIGLVMAATFAFAGTWLVVRMIARTEATDSEAPTPKEPWFRRITGWIAAIVWCGAAVAWNVGIIGWQLRMARDGRGWSMVILIPWSLIGWFLMVVLFVGIGVVIDSIVGMFRRA